MAFGDPEARVREEPRQDRLGLGEGLEAGGLPGDGPDPVGGGLRGKAREVQPGALGQGQLVEAVARVGEVERQGAAGEGVEDLLGQVIGVVGVLEPGEDPRPSVEIDQLVEMPVLELEPGSTALPALAQKLGAGAGHRLGQLGAPGAEPEEPHLGPGHAVIGLGPAFEHEGGVDGTGGEAAAPVGRREPRIGGEAGAVGTGEAVIGQEVIGDAVEGENPAGHMVELDHRKPAVCSLYRADSVERAAAPDGVPEGLLGQEHHRAAASAPVLDHLAGGRGDVEHMGEEMEIGRFRPVDMDDPALEERGQRRVGHRHPVAVRPVPPDPDHACPVLPFARLLLPRSGRREQPGCQVTCLLRAAR